MPDRSNALGREAWRVLRELVRETLKRKGAGSAVERDLGAIDLAFDWRPGEEGPDAEDGFARSLVDAVDRRVDEAVEHALRFRPGRAWCFRCKDAACEHAAPRDSREVLAGYGPTGTPSWAEFGQWALDRKHPEVDRLYADPPGLIGIVQRAGETDRRMLPAFREGRFRPLAQATVGYWSFADHPADGRGALALTFQVAATPRSGRGWRLGLNTIGRAPGGEPLDRLWERRTDLPWRKAVNWAQAALRSVATDGSRNRKRVEDRVDGILEGFVRRLLREERARCRRTRHASERHLSRSRPTGLAVKDARETPVERWLMDVRQGTWVVLGDRGRTHFFNEDGKLVSSVRYRRDAIDRKRRAGAWKPAAAADVHRLRNRLVGDSGDVERAD